ncbi:MAG: patatin-like phospholipase family protein [Tardiphaga sp.]|jgi:Patatin-like phospholipase
MSGFDGGAPGDSKFFCILSLDGGGIRGVFPAAFLARLEEYLEHQIGRYFDLIAGTSTGGIIAIGLGLGLSAGEIFKLYVEQGPLIFDQEHGAENWVRPNCAAWRTYSSPSTPRSRCASRKCAGSAKTWRELHAAGDPGVASGSGARLHLQDGAPSKARN